MSSVAPPDDGPRRPGAAGDRLLSPRLLGQLARFRLAAHRRVHGRDAGGHASVRHGSSLDFADHREYVPGDDPRSIDQAAYLRLGRLLVKLYEAEDEAAVRVVVDGSASMGFGAKARRAAEVAAALCAVAAGGQDRVRVVIAGSADGPGSVQAGPWLRGPAALPAIEAQLAAHRPARADTGAGPERPADLLVAAVRRARGEGPRGPVVVVSDLLFDGWDEVLRALAAGRGDGLVVHLLGRGDLCPPETGDLRLVDGETGRDVEVSIDDAARDAYAAARDRWLTEVAAEAGRHGLVYARLVDDQPVEDLLLGTLRRLGVVVG